MKAILVAGTHVGVGKTTIAVGLTAALVKRGLKVQTFKVGADWFDPGYLAAASGRPCFALDLWMMPKRAILETYAKRTLGADIAIIDGMWGLFDGMSMKGMAVSTADLDGLLGAPVLLVVDASHMAESAAAAVHGFATFGELPVEGCLFNRVGESRYERLKSAVAVAGSVRPCGFLPPEPILQWPERGQTIAAADGSKIKESLAAIAKKVEDTVDVDALLEIAEDAAAPKGGTPTKNKMLRPRTKIAVAQDAAFHFYYEENLGALKSAGAELVPFSPLEDAELPSGVGGLYLGGGFAEIHAERLDKNRTMRDSVRKAIDDGMPTLAECGGMLYLVKHFVGSGVRAWEMAGVLPGEVRVGPPTSGYVTGEAQRGTFLMEKGAKLKGHEFHVSAWSEDGKESPAFRLLKPGRDDGRLEGCGRDNLHASSLHLHFSSCPDVPRRFAEAAEEFAKGRKPARKKK
jgi:cobyrinic acid a,c-diamide synthase